MWIQNWLARNNEGRGVLNMMQNELRIQELLTRIAPHIEDSDPVMRQAISPR